ncbi:MAG: hypothetical protein N3C12_04065 [Candidatus Binatia bacterium]|nr:hypothetical protein [Candidatus Binatia bacterium]
MAAPLPAPEIEFVNSTNTKLRHWPIAASLPMPRASGPVDAGKIALEFSGGHRVPTTARVLTRWPDGSPHWIRLQGEADLPPGQTKATVRLEDPPGVKSPPPRPVRPVSVREDRQRIQVENGTLRFSVRRGSRFWVENLSTEQKKLDGASLKGAAHVDGRNVFAGPVEQVRVLDSGPLRAMVELSGRYDNSPLVYRVRLECFANHPFLRVFHTFEVHSNEVTYERIAQLEAQLVLPKLHKGGLTVEVEGRAQHLAERAPVVIAQRDNSTYTVRHRTETGRLTGWFDAHNRHLGVTLWARWFWQQYPQAIRLEGERLVYALYGGDERPALAGTGSAKTHEFVLAFREGGESPSSSALSSVPLEGRVSPEWLVSARALRQASLTRTAAGRRFLTNLAESWDRVLRSYEREEWDDRQEVECPNSPGATDPHERRRRGFYGMWNWGDWNYPGYHDTTKGCDAWGNLEYDLTRVLALTYWLTGDGRFYDSMVAAGRHFMDVDVIHYQPRYPQWVGMNHPKNPLHWSFELGGVDLGHTWTEGLLSMYLLTGDERALEAARGIGDFLLRRVRAPIKGNPRQFGWPQIALIALYDVTGDGRYLEGAKVYARLGMERHAPEKVQDWKLGILAEGLSYTHRITGDAAIKDWLKKYSEAVLAHPATLDRRVWPAVAYVAALEQNHGAAARARSVVEQLDFGGWAKPFTIAARVGFAVLGNLAELKGDSVTTDEVDADSRRTPIPTEAPNRGWQ